MFVLILLYQNTRFLYIETIFGELFWILLLVLLFVSPLVVGVFAVMYYGGKAIRLHLSTSRVVFGYIRVILGFLLLTVAQWLYIFLEAMTCYAFGFDITG